MSNELPVKILAPPFAIQFLDPDFLTECEILAICGRSQWILAFDKLKVRSISISGLFDLLT